MSSGEDSDPRQIAALLVSSYSTHDMEQLGNANKARRSGDIPGDFDTRSIYIRRSDETKFTGDSSHIPTILIHFSSGAFCLLYKNIVFIVSNILFSSYIFYPILDFFSIVNDFRKNPTF